MAASKYKRYGRFAQRCDHFCYGKSCFHIPAHGIQKNKYPIDLTAVFYGCKLWQDMLIFRGLDRLRQDLVSLDLADDRQRVNVSPA